MSDPGPVMLFDATGILVRCAKAAKRMKPLSSNGVRTNELLLFINTVTKHIRERHPGHIIMCWDGIRDASESWRHRACSDYKPDRNYPERAPSLIQGFCAAAGFRNNSYLGFEADDIVAAWWRALPCDEHVFIVSDDADFHQLLDRRYVEQVSIDGTQVWDSAYVEKFLHCDPAMWPVLRAISGDPSDGIPGVPGYGPVKALTLLQDCGWNLVNVFQKLPEHAEKIRQWYEIMDLRNPLYRPPPMVFSLLLQPWEHTGHQGALTSFLQAYEMNSVLKRLGAGTLFRG